MIPRLTLAGQEIVLRALNGETLTFKSIKIGNGEAPADYSTLTDLQNPLKTISLVDSSIDEGYVILQGETIRNSDFESDFFWTELGVFVEDPDGGEDILYAYAHYQLSGDRGAAYISRTSSSAMQITPIINVFIGDVENVTAILSEATEYASKEDLNAHTNSRANPHNVSKSQVGLGNVPNVSTNDQTPTYTRPSAVSRLISGEKLSVAFGKIAMAIDSYISHIADRIIHVTSADRSKWDSKADGTHNHSASDINSGTLPISRGGTGASSAHAAKLNLGIQTGVNTIDGKQTGITKTINFTQAFSSAPKTVLLQPHNLAYGLGESSYSLEVISITNTDFTVRCYAASYITINFGWVAFTY